MRFKIQLLSLPFAMLLVLQIGAAQETNPDQRRTPKQIDALTPTEAGAGTSGVNGIQTRVLKGDPTKPGLYTIQLTVPANTKIQAHTHRDDRVATVVSGTWYIGYGSRLDEQNLRLWLPAASIPNRRTWRISRVPEISLCQFR